MRLYKKQALKVSAGLLFLLAIMDFVRGFMHTFLNEYAVATFAQISSDPDALFLLAVFGVSNFVTSFIFFLVYFKARHLSPYVLLMVFAGYVLGVLGIRFAGLSMESPFYGQYMMMVYLGLTLTVPLLYFTAKDDHKPIQAKRRTKK